MAKSQRMPYDEGLAERIRDLLPGCRERRMFGGIGWIERGNFVAGVWKDDLMVRVPPDETPQWLQEPGTKVFDVTGRPMRGWLLVSPESIAEEPELRDWVERSRKFVRTLPAK